MYFNWVNIIVDLFVVLFTLLIIEFLVNLASFLESVSFQSQKVHAVKIALNFSMLKIVLAIIQPITKGGTSTNMNHALTGQVCMYN